MTSKEKLEALVPIIEAIALLEIERIEIMERAERYFLRRGQIAIPPQPTRLTEPRQASS